MNYPPPFYSKQVAQEKPETDCCLFISGITRVACNILFLPVIGVFAMLSEIMFIL